ncbi:flagellar export chaperone FlgN [Rhodohalobacter sp. 8-1]|uniref:flagellar export chaperone FlgN n=1 Tax=Rhodohalobacter sp. 8-1 TaxID=3131972 RepID=UPI0030ED0E30
MNTQTISTDQLRDMDNIVLDLRETSEQLIYVMEEQIQAIISSSPEKIEELTEKQTAIQSEYKKYERAFIVELERNVEGSDDGGLPKLGDLVMRFPGEEQVINQWKATLSQNAKNLQRKNKQLVDLLEFALNRNTRLMHSFYTLFNNKNSHYSPTGQKSHVASGVAVNQEA